MAGQVAVFYGLLDNHAASIKNHHHMPFATTKYASGIKIHIPDRYFGLLQTKTSTARNGMFMLVECYALTIMDS